MRRGILILPVLFFSCFAVAETTFSNAVGLGFQYGGLGWQGRLSGETLHGRIGAGVAAVSAGVDVSLTERFLVGATYADGYIANYRALTFIYAPNGVGARGLELGLDFGTAEFDEDFIFGLVEGEEASGLIGFNIGFVF